MKITRSSVLPLLAVMAISLLFLADAVSGLEITNHPISKVVKLGQTATFSCSATGESFDIVIKPPFRSSPMYIYRGGPRPNWMTANIDHIANSFTTNFSIIGNEDTNRTNISCRIFNYMEDLVFSNTATLTVIGPPVTPTHLLLLLTSDDRKAGQFTVIWDTPYSNEEHPITGYTITLTSLNTGHVSNNKISVFPTSGPVQQTLSFPPRTESCDILNISITATNDIGTSQPAYKELLIPTTVGSVDVEIVKQYHSQGGSLGDVLVTIDIKFPRFCWFETVKYTVVLEKVGGEGETILKNGSIVDPQDPVTETLSSDVVANTNYSVVVKSWTSYWNYTASPLYFTYGEMVTDGSQSTSDKPTSGPSVGGVGDNTESESMLSPVVLGGAGGAIGLLLILITIVIITIWYLRSRNKRPRGPITIEDMKSSRVLHDLIPNPIYGGPLYETVGDPVPPDSLNFKPEHYPLPPTTITRESVYSESPTLNKHRQINLTEDGEEAYIQMNTSTTK